MQAGVEKAIRQVHSEAQQSGLPFFRSRFQACCPCDSHRMCSTEAHSSTIRCVIRLAAASSPALHRDCHVPSHAPQSHEQHHLNTAPSISTSVQGARIPAWHAACSVTRSALLHTPSRSPRHTSCPTHLSTRRTARAHGTRSSRKPSTSARRIACRTWSPCSVVLGTWRPCSRAGAACRLRPT